MKKVYLGEWRNAPRHLILTNDKIETNYIYRNPIYWAYAYRDSSLIIYENGAVIINDDWESNGIDEYSEVDVVKYDEQNRPYVEVELSFI